MNTEPPVEPPIPDEGPEAIAFDPPAPVFLVTEDNVVLTEPLFEIEGNMRVAIPNPWADSEDYAIGVVRGRPGQWMLDVGRSLGKLELMEGGWKCVGLARINAIAQGMALESAGVPLPPPEPKSFTAKLLKRAAKAKKTRKTK